MFRCVNSFQWLGVPTCKVNLYSCRSRDDQSLPSPTYFLYSPLHLRIISDLLRTPKKEAIVELPTFDMSTANLIVHLTCWVWTMPYLRRIPYCVPFFVKEHLGKVNCSKYLCRGCRREKKKSLSSLNVSGPSQMGWKSMPNFPNKKPSRLLWQSK